MKEERVADPGFVGPPFKISSYRVLISHRYVRSAEYLRLVAMLDREAQRDATWRWENFSVPRDAKIMTASEALQGEIYEARMRERISKVHVILFILRDEWLEDFGSLYLELVEAPLVSHRPKIPIVSVLPRGEEQQALKYQSPGIATVKWNAKAIVRAIRQYAIPASAKELLLNPAEARERARIVKALRANAGRPARTAAALGISTTNLKRKRLAYIIREP